MNNLKATKRDNITSGSNNKLRADGLIPAILYGGKSPNQNISVSKKDISSITIIMVRMYACISMRVIHGNISMYLPKHKLM